MGGRAKSGGNQAPLSTLLSQSRCAGVHGSSTGIVENVGSCSRLGFCTYSSVYDWARRATTGYANLPLAAIVFGAVVSTRVALGPGGGEHRGLAAALSALAAWTKIEGLCLAACLAGSVILARLISTKAADETPGSTRLILLLIIGPFVLIGPWWGMGQIIGAVPNGDFMSVSAANVTANLSRLPMIVALMSQELLRAGRWAALWPAFAVIVALYLRQQRHPSNCVVTAMVVAPLLIYMFIYTLSAWPDLSEHIGTSFPRLLLPLARSRGLAQSGPCGMRCIGRSEPGNRARLRSTCRPHMTWHLITADNPPQVGGVSDYSRLIAEGLADAGDDVHVWCPPRSAGPEGLRVKIHPELGRIGLRDLRALDCLLDKFAPPRRLLVQWVPHGFGWHSMNLSFCLWVHRRARRGDRIELMVHEPFLEFRSGRVHHGVMAAIHRLMTIVLLNAAAGFGSRFRHGNVFCGPMRWSSGSV